MSDPSKTINTFIQSCSLVRDQQGSSVEADDVQAALSDVLGIDDEMKLVSHLEGMTPEQIAEILEEYDFDRVRPVILEEIYLEEVLQIEGVDHFFKEERIKEKGEIWQIHKNDADPFPHPIHAHSYARRVKMDLRNGDIYRKRKLEGQMPAKELIALREKVRTIDLPPLDSEIKSR